MIDLKSLFPQRRDSWIILAGIVVVALLLAGIALGPILN